MSFLISSTPSTSSLSQLPRNVSYTLKQCLLPPWAKHSHPAISFLQQHSCQRHASFRLERVPQSSVLFFLVILLFVVQSSNSMLPWHGSCRLQVVLFCARCSGLQQFISFGPILCRAEPEHISNTKSKLLPACPVFLPYRVLPNCAFLIFPTSLTSIRLCTISLHFPVLAASSASRASIFGSSSTPFCSMPCFLSILVKKKTTFLLAAA